MRIFGNVQVFFLRGRDVFFKKFISLMFNLRYLIERSVANQAALLCAKERGIINIMERPCKINGCLGECKY